MKKTFLIFMILFFMVLMQIHSIKFWNSNAGEWGWLFSISLEIAMLFFWYENTRRFYFFKYLSAALLITGVWYQISLPLFENINSISGIRADIEMTQNAIQQLSRSLERDEIKSDTRLGWDDHLEVTRADLKEARTHLSGLRAKGGRKPQPFRSYAVAVIMSITLFITLTAQLRMITVLQICYVTKSGKPLRKRNENHSNKILEQSQKGYETDIQIATEKIIRQLEQFGSQAELCRERNIRPEYITAILNHDEKKEAGLGIISHKALRKVVDILGKI